MATPKAKTLQQRFGFMDKELSTPQHDNIMIWLDGYVSNTMFPRREISFSFMDDDENIYETEESIRAFHSQWKAKYNKDNILGNIPSFSGIAEINKTWEQPITSGRNKFIIGFVDMYVTVEQERAISISLSRGLYQSAEYSWVIHNSRSYCAFEVKPSIRSVGEVLRQINMYKVNLQVDYYIVCPDDRFKSILESQGVGFIKCPNFKDDPFDEAMR